MKKLLTTALLCVIIKFSFAQNVFAAYTKNATATFPVDATVTTTPEGIVTYAPTAAVTYSKDLNKNAQSTSRLFDKTLIWFYKSFFHTYDKIITSNKEAGIITGRTFFYSTYNVPEKEGTVKAFDYTNYNFEWTVKIENGKMNFSIANIYINKNVYDHKDINQKTAVTHAVKIPYSVLTQSDKKMENDWGISKSYLITNIDALVASLNKELATDSDLTWVF